MPSMRPWKLSQPPNYTSNIDKIYPYSEVPYLGEYNLVQLPITDDLIEHIDYWGEGRIDVQGDISGFKDSYNINHQYQLVSNGSDTGRKIPNRIPVISYINCDTSSYIKNNGVKLVTVMGAPINRSCAQDIARMTNNNQGIVVIYGFNEESADVKNLEEALKKKSILLCHDYELQDILKGLTLFDSHRVYVNENVLMENLRSNVRKGLLDNALKIVRTCDNSENKNLIKSSVEQLLNDGEKNIVPFAYKLWLEHKNIVKDSFPQSFNLIFNEDKVRIVNKLHDMALRLDVNDNSNGDRLVWGDAVNSSNDKVIWKFHPIWDDGKLFFQIENLEHSMMLRLDTNSDMYGDRLCLGTAQKENKKSLRFTLEPIKKKDDVIFLIFNVEFEQYLKLDVTTDSDGNRKLWANDYFVNNDYHRFGWYIESS